MVKLMFGIHDLRLGLATVTLALMLLSVVMRGEIVAQEPSVPGARVSDATHPTIRTVVSKDSVQVAEPFTLELIVTAPAGTEVAFPPSVDALGSFDVLEFRDRLDVPAENASGVRSWSRVLTLETIETGELEIPSMEVVITPAVNAEDGGVVGLLQSQPISMRVQSVLEERADPTRYRDIEPVVDLEVSANMAPSKVGWWLAGGVGLTLAALMALVSTLWFAKRSSSIDPLKWFLHELDMLRQSLASPAQHSPADHRTAGTTEAAMGELSLLLRRYLELQFVSAASTLTSQQLLQVIERDERISPEEFDRYRRLLEECDLVQFAGLPVTSATAIAACDEARALAQETADRSRAPFPSAPSIRSRNDAP